MRASILTNGFKVVIVESINRLASDRTRKNSLPGMTLQAICDRLNGEGIITRLGKQWTPNQVLVILNG